MRLIQRKRGCVFLSAIVGLLGLLLAGCATNDPSPGSNQVEAQTQPQTQPQGQAPQPTDAEKGVYVRDPIDIGDRVRIDLNPGFTLSPIETDIKGDGAIEFPDIGRVQVAGRTPGELESDLQKLYVPKYYTHMAVTVTPVVRYFYVYGQVAGIQGGGGKQFYTGPITVTQAIAAAGGFTDFANRKKVRLRRRSDGSTKMINCVKAITHPELDLWVHPGDIIWVDRRHI